MTTQVLIAGAGPTGLNLAIWLTRVGVKVRIVDKHNGVGQASRAMAVQARTLEFYRQLGFVQRVLDAGIPMKCFRLREGRRELATVRLDEAGTDISPYNYALSFPQDHHEKLLLSELQKLGVDVEWDTELTRFEQAADRVIATLTRGETSSDVTADYLCGCDGARSTVRQSLGLAFAGGTYDQQFFVSDVEATGLLGESDVNLFLGSQSLYAVFPVRRAGVQRLLGTVPPELIGRELVTFEDLRARVETQLGIRVTSVNWFSTYRVHHRVTERFRVGRVLLAGDAAHVHSPAGGQGMNTGIGDAINLAWKLADVLKRRRSDTLLDTYEQERSGFAHSLVATTDRLFAAMIGKGPGPRLFRRLVLPYVVPLALGLPPVRRAQFRLISQTHIHYPDSRLSHGSAGDIDGGDRLPWVADIDNFKPLQNLDWQIHVYGDAAEPVRQFARQRELSLQVFPWTDSCDAAGLKRDAFYLVRPDGYVAAAGTAVETAVMAAALEDPPIHSDDAAPEVVAARQAR